MTAPRVLLTGATGYVGGRLLAELERRGESVRCFVRRPEALRGRAAPSTEIAAGDALDAPAVARALEGVEAAYYLIHSMGGEDFAARDREAARIFGRAAREAGVRRIIYLGGLGEGAGGLSEHLRSRQETGEVLRQSGVPVVELRASIVLGSGSLSFEMIRALVERLPVMICPRWVAVEAQPIAVEDVIAYLASALDLPAGAERDLRDRRPGPGDLRRSDARVRAPARPEAALDPGAAADAAALEPLARPGDAALRARRPKARGQPSQPHGHPGSRRARGLPGQAARRARGDRPGPRNEDEAFARTRWSDAVSSSGLTERYGGDRVGTRFVDSRKTFVPVPPAAAFAPIRRIGGDIGWYYGNVLWRLRGYLDLLVGGVGLRRGRRRADELGPGDALDFWRVESFEPDRLLRLRAEMRVPGRAWLQFETDAGPGRHRDPADRHLRRVRPLRPRLLVRPLPASPLRFRRHAPRHRRPRSAVECLMKRVDVAPRPDRRPLITQMSRVQCLPRKRKIKGSANLKGRSKREGSSSFRNEVSPIDSQQPYGLSRLFAVCYRSF